MLPGTAATGERDIQGCKRQAVRLFPRDDLGAYGHVRKQRLAAHGLVGGGGGGVQRKPLGDRRPFIREAVCSNDRILHYVAGESHVTELI